MVNTNPELLFGSIAVRLGYLTKEQLDALVEEQARPATKPPRLGELGVERGVLKPEQVEGILQSQKGSLPEDARRLGALAVKNGFAGDDEVEMALEAQKGASGEEGPPAKIGQILIEMGTLSPQQVEALLAAQARLRQGNGHPVAPPDKEAVKEAADVVKQAAAAAAVEGAQALDRSLSKVAPGIHNQRKYILAAAAAGVVSCLLPWKFVVNAGSVLGVADWGVFTLVMYALAGAAALLGNRGEAIILMHRAGVFVPAALGFAAAACRFLYVWLNYNLDVLIGLYLAVPAGAGIIATLVFTKPPADATPGTAPQKIFDRLRRLFRDMSGKRAKERTEAAAKRDVLLRQIGEAALRAGAGGEEAESAFKAQEAFEAIRKKYPELGDSTSGTKSKGSRAGAAATKDLMRAKTELKSAQGRLDRALQKLGRHAADAGVAPEGEEARLAELKSLDAVVQDLT
jgi:hypothetical protein